MTKSKGGRPPSRENIKTIVCRQKLAEMEDDYWYHVKRLVDAGDPDILKTLFKYYAPAYLDRAMPLGLTPGAREKWPREIFELVNQGEIGPTRAEKLINMICKIDEHEALMRLKELENKIALLEQKA